MSTIQIIVDETAPTSFELLVELQKLGETERAAEGIYYVEAEEKPVIALADQYPQAVIKARAV